MCKDKQYEMAWIKPTSSICTLDLNPEKLTTYCATTKKSWNMLERSTTFIDIYDWLGWKGITVKGQRQTWHIAQQ